MRCFATPRTGLGHAPGTAESMTMGSPLNGSKGGRPAFDPVMMFKMLILQALNDFPRRTVRQRMINRPPRTRFLTVPERR